jgi:hypothetical protein
LDFKTNALSGPIPTVLSTLTALDYISFNSNGFTGTIPSSLAALTTLAYLDIYSNYLTGTIPSQLSALQNMSYLELGYNGDPSTRPNTGLRGPIPVWMNGFNWPKLNYLSLTRNRLTGPIPGTVSTLQMLSYLRLSGNYLTGTLSPTYAGLSSGKLTYLRCVLLKGQKMRALSVCNLGRPPPPSFFMQYPEQLHDGSDALVVQECGTPDHHVQRFRWHGLLESNTPDRPAYQAAVASTYRQADTSVGPANASTDTTADIAAHTATHDAADAPADPAAHVAPVAQANITPHATAHVPANTAADAAAHVAALRSAVDAADDAAHTGTKRAAVGAAIITAV